MLVVRVVFPIALVEYEDLRRMRTDISTLRMLLLVKKKKKLAK